jgi:hypothetical protein
VTIADDEVTSLANAVRAFESALSRHTEASRLLKIDEDNVAKKRNDLEAATSALTAARARVVDCARRVK